MPERFEAPGNEEYGIYYDRVAETTGWRGADVVFGLAYEHVQPGEALLDIGIGTGLGSVLFHRAGLRIFGVDADERMLDAARRKGFAVALAEHDLTSLPYPYGNASFDHAICVGVLNFLEDPSPVFEETARLLRNGGLFGFTTGDRDEDEPVELTAGSEHTGDGRSVTIYRHSTGQVAELLSGHGFTLLKELEFTTFVDEERTQKMRAKAHLVRRGPSE